MESKPPTAPVSKPARVTGYILSIVPVLMLLFSGAMKFIPSTQLNEGFAHLGWPIGLAPVLAVLELGCTIIYLIPRTSVLGAILLTGYMGGAIATHVRIEEAVYLHVAFGVMLWGGLWLRDPRLRALIPLKS